MTNTKFKRGQVIQHNSDNCANKTFTVLNVKSNILVLCEQTGQNKTFFWPEKEKFSPKVENFRRGQILRSNSTGTRVAVLEVSNFLELLNVITGNTSVLNLEDALAEYTIILGA
jgi:hypothetical protein